MMNYTVWKRENLEDELVIEELLIEVFNGCDLLNVQKQFVNNGYIITECFDTNNASFIRCYKVNE